VILSVIETIALPDGYAAAARWWRPADPHGAVLYFHGIQSHGGWYEQSAGLLAAQGFTVLMPDRRGSGLNRVQRGHADSAPQLLADAKAALQTLLRETGGASVHVVGVSWGGKLGVALADAAGDKVRSLSLVAPGLFPKVDLTRTDKFRVALAMLAERERMFDIPLNAPRLFTANPERIAFLDGDRLKLTQVSASFLLASRRLDRVVRQFSKSSWRGPIHLLLAGRDRIIDNEPTRRWFRSLPSPDRRITEYPDAEHTIEFESAPAAFLHDLAAWLADHAA
jgi:alpha-beta hydrolase superfamily lysophospholipase